MNINYNVQTQAQSNGNVGRSAMALTRPAMMGAGLLALGTAALGIFDIFRMPGLEEQIRDLEEEIDRLEVEVVRLSFQNDRFEELNGLLNESLTDLVILNDQLNDTATELEVQVDALNNTVANISNTADELTANGEYFEELNGELNQTQQALEAEIVKLQVLEENYTDTNAQLINRTQELSVEVRELSNITTGLGESIVELETQVETLTDSNDRLDQAVTDLTTVTQYMDEYFADYDATLIEVGTELNNTIANNRAGVFLELEGYYRDIVTQWNCRNDDLFDDYLFWQNKSTPISESGSIAFGALTTVLDARMLRPMCLSVLNFEKYLRDTEGPLDQVTYNNFESSAGSYGNLAIKHYDLPFGSCTHDDYDDCVSATEWEEGAFECKNVDPFIY